MLPRSDLRLTPAIRAAAGIVGAAVFGTGVAAVFVTENGTGAAALLAIGAAFVVFAVLGDRVQNVELGGVTLTMRDLARQTYALADEVERSGDEESASQLRAAAKELEALARAYRRMRRSMRAGDERTGALDRVVDEAERLSQRAAFNAEDVRRWFDAGTPEARVTALGLMKGNPRLRDFEAALDAIAESRSAFEQYHGLELALRMVPDLSPPQRAELTLVVEQALRSRRLRHDNSRQQTATEILEALRP